MVFFVFTVIQILINILYVNSGVSDHKPHSAVSNLCLHCLTLSHKGTLSLYGFNWNFVFLLIGVKDQL